MNQTLLVYFLLILSFSTFAQKDPDAEIVLKAMADKALAYKSIQSDFEYIVENMQTKSEEKYLGSMLLKGDKFRLSTEGTITYCDGITRWVFLEESNEVNVSKRVVSDNLEAEEKFLNNPISLFTLYKSGFKYMKSGAETISNKNYQIIDLSPEDLNKNYFKIRCWISEANDLYMVRFFQKDGTRITFTFKSFVANTKTKDSDFTFQPKDHPGVEIIDLRE